jgi:hypothetical protein
MIPRNLSESHHSSLRIGEGDNKVIVLTGAGQSANLGYKTLKTIMDSDTGIKLPLNFNSSHEILQGTWRKMLAQKREDATFEDVIYQLKIYIKATEILTNDPVYRNVLGDIYATVKSHNLDRVWQDALSECYKIMIKYYGPHIAKTDANEYYKTTIHLFKELASINGGSLFVFTTNYDCGLNVIASRTDEISFKSHINSSQYRGGQFDKDWYCVRTDLEEKDLPIIYLNRLHGSVAWFYDNDLAYKLREVFGAGGGLEDEDLPFINEMVIKLVSEEEIGKNPAFNHAFEEFYEALKSCKVLFVWGHSFRDIEVVSTIQRAFESRTNDPFKILILDPYLSEKKVKYNMTSSLRKRAIPVYEIDIEKVPWIIRNGPDKIVPSTISTIRKLLLKKEDRENDQER